MRIIGRLMSETGVPFIQSHLHIGVPGDRHHQFLMAVGRDGFFDLNWVLAGTWEIRFSGVGHWEAAFPSDYFTDQSGWREIILKRVRYPVNPERVFVFGDFNDWSLDHPIELQKQPRDLWRETIRISQSPVCYKFMNLLTPTESATDLTATDFVYDGHGGYNSLALEMDGAVEFFYDPQKQNSLVGLRR